MNSGHRMKVEILRAGDDVGQDHADSPGTLDFGALGHPVKHATVTHHHLAGGLRCV